MAPAFIKNTDKPFQCMQCGSDEVAVVREDPNGANPRLKCNQCQFMFNGEDSLSAIEAGAINPSSKESLASATEPEVTQINKRNYEGTVHSPSRSSNTNVPGTPAFVFLSKPRGEVQFCTKRDFKRTAIQWSERKFDLYELKLIKLHVKVDIQPNDK